MGALYAAILIANVGTILGSIHSLYVGVGVDDEPLTESRIKRRRIAVIVNVIALIGFAGHVYGYGAEAWSNAELISVWGMLIWLGFGMFGNMILALNEQDDWS